MAIPEAVRGLENDLRNIFGAMLNAPCGNLSIYRIVNLPLCLSHLRRNFFILRDNERQIPPADIVEERGKKGPGAFFIRLF